MLFLCFACTDSLAANLTLSWDQSPDTTTKGYIICYGTSPGIYDWQINVGNATKHEFHDLDNETTYYFAVSAYNILGKLSDYSSEISTKNS